jgi:predicted AAA+ superfamily ATPase
MAMTNHDRVGKALELLKAGLGPFVDREIKAAITAKNLSAHQIKNYLDDPLLANKNLTEWDASALLKLMWETWNEAFRNTLGHSERSLVSEIRSWRNKWAHQEPFSSDDAYRALDSSGRLLTAISAPQAEDIEKAKMELLRVRFDEQTRGEKRKSSSTPIEGTAVSGLRPWREIITPHEDVASGRYQQAEFAADLWQVHLGGGTAEYLDPVEFFRRTYLTDSLKEMLTSAVLRLSGKGGDPVIELQTNFGGGKTHSMLALYHLFSGAKPKDLAGVDEILAKAEQSEVPKAQRAVFVGNKVSPSTPSVKPDGSVVRTIWGEIAWQLGGKEALSRVKEDDEKATSPGDVLRELFDDYGPCLILIDEWVAYARQLHDQSDLPAGGFETQFTFAQVLTESAKLARNCLLVVSLPASDSAVSPHGQVDDVEVGGERGREALHRLGNVVRRVASSWRPAGAEEGFEIVRRRLFKPMTEPDQFKQRDLVARTFADFYRNQQSEFPIETRDGDYEQRIKAAYPIHPEIFDRLYTDWSTLVKFQRTRGVLRLMATVIHSLWEKGDRGPLIMPANIAIDDPRVQSELTRNLPDNWVPVIEKDVDGPNSLPLKIDGEISNLGKFSACRRVARTIYLGSAPTTGAAHKGIEDRRVKLGCVLPGESPAVFGDALRRMAGAATYLYQDGPHYWYSLQPTVIKLAEDRAEQLKREPDKFILEIEKRLRKNAESGGDFSRVHVLPQSGVDVPDDLEARLVVLGTAFPYAKDENPAEVAAKGILEMRGNSPRLYRNTLVFAAADRTRLQDLEDAARRYLAWQSILADEANLGLTHHQKKQVEIQISSADSVLNSRIPETYQWLLVPIQPAPQDPIKWEVLKLSGNEPLGIRAAKKLRTEELLLSSFAPTRLRMELDRLLWRDGNHVPVNQLVEDFAKYVYLPRLKDPSVLLKSISDGVSLLTWAQDGVGLADSFDAVAARYRGLRGGTVDLLHDPHSDVLVVKPEIAYKQMTSEALSASPQAPGSPVIPGNVVGGTGTESTIPSPPPQASRPKRFHGSVELDATRAGRDAGKIAEEIISHLSGLMGAEVKVTLEIEAQIPDGAPDNVVRTVTENSRTLKFKTQGFESE